MYWIFFNLIEVFNPLWKCDEQWFNFFTCFISYVVSYIRFFVLTITKISDSSTFLISTYIDCLLKTMELIFFFSNSVSLNFNWSTIPLISYIAENFCLNRNKKNRILSEFFCFCPFKDKLFYNWTAQLTF